MQLSDFHYDLPRELIAQEPAAERSGSRLLVLTPDGPVHEHFPALLDRLRPEDLLVVNDTRVVPARLRAAKASGGRVEILLERFLDDRDFLAQVRTSKALKPGGRLHVDAGGPELEVIGRYGPFYRLRAPTALLGLFEAHGEMPLPPYIERPPEAADAERYQTLFARAPGAVAAPTASLHFDAALLERLDAVGIERVAVTLHVGAGTFQPLREPDIDRHVMHAEWLQVSEQVVTAAARARARGGRVVAVGTTVVRALESAAAHGALRPYVGDTRLFITPGYRFRVVDALVTNFHLPESTLLMLVCAFAGQEPVLAAYRAAVAERYRFFSYGDAMFLEKRPDPLTERSS